MRNVLVAVTGHKYLLIGLAAAFAVVTPTRPAAADGAATDRLVQQWLALEQQAAALESDWRRHRPAMEQRLKLLAVEKQQLQRLLTDNRDGSTEVQAQREVLLHEQTQMEAKQEVVNRELRIVLDALEATAEQLPPPLIQAWRAEQATLSADANASQQLQVALAQLSKFMEFNNRVSLYEMPITSAEGQQILVKQLYLGVAGAWFISADGSYAGRGFPSPEGWQWVFDDSIDRRAIVDAIAVFEKRRSAELVQLPFQLESFNLSSARLDDLQVSDRSAVIAEGD